MTAADELIHEYLADLCPDEMMDALRGLAAVEYPVNDAKELAERLREQKRKPGLLALLQPADFPLAGPRNAFEKLGARTEPREFPEPPIVEPPLPPPGEFDEPTAPGISRRESYREMFSPFCAERAYAVYVERFDGTAKSDVESFMKGREKGEECEALMGALRRWHLRRIVPGVPPRLPFPPG